MPPVAPLNLTPPKQPPPAPIDGGRGALFNRLRWEIPDVRRALDLLDAGSFSEVVRLRTAIRRDPRARGAEEQPAATLLGLPLTLEAGTSEHGNSPMESMRRAAAGLFGGEGRSANAGVLKETTEDLLGFAAKWAWIHFEPSAGGATWDPVLTPWPMNAVRWDATLRGYVAVLDGGTEVPIHGENWIEFSMAREKPHMRGAVRSIGETWMVRQYAIQDGATRSGSVREAKMMGELPPDVPIGSLKAQQMAADMQGLVRERGGILYEHGAKVTVQEASGLVHKIFFDLEKLSASDFAIAYSGQDGTTSLGDQGTYGARQVLYGVSYDLLRGLARVLCGGLNEVLRRWAFYNFGRDTYPRAVIRVPDLEAEQARKTAADRRPLMIKELESLAARGPLERDVVVEVADRYGQVVSDEWAALWAQPKPERVELPLTVGE